jgi:hypothetical protein
LKGLKHLKQQQGIGAINGEITELIQVRNLKIKKKISILILCYNFQGKNSNP